MLNTTLLFKMAPLFTAVKVRLQRMVETRNYFFKQTTRADAKKYLDQRRWFVGMLESEVAALELVLKYQFPADFRAYLLEFGQNCGELFGRGQDINPKELLEYQKWGRALLEKNGITSFVHPNTVFFEFHQGYACSFFHPNEDGHAVVYQYMEGNPAPKKAFVSFTAMLGAELKNLEQIHADLNKGSGYFVIIKEERIQMQYPRLSSGIVPREIGDQFLD